MALYIHPLLRTQSMALLFRNLNVLSYCSTRPRVHEGKKR